jgi:hypothetical protein
MLEEPSTIAIDDAAGSVAAIGTAAEVLADKEPKDIRVIHPLGARQLKTELGLTGGQTAGRRLSGLTPPAGRLA